PGLGRTHSSSLNNYPVTPISFFSFMIALRASVALSGFLLRPMLWRVVIITIGVFPSTQMSVSSSSGVLAGFMVIWKPPWPLFSMGCVSSILMGAARITRVLVVMG